MTDTYAFDKLSLLRSAFGCASWTIQSIGPPPWSVIWTKDEGHYSSESQGYRHIRTKQYLVVRNWHQPLRVWIEVLVTYACPLRPQSSPASLGHPSAFTTLFRNPSSSAYIAPYSLKHCTSVVRSFELSCNVCNWSCINFNLHYFCCYFSFFVFTCFFKNVPWLLLL